MIQQWRKEKHWQSLRIKPTLGKGYRDGMPKSIEIR